MKTKLLNLAYSHDADADQYVIFKQTDAGDYAIQTCTTQAEADQWLEDNFVCVRTGVDYNLYLPFQIDLTK